MNSSVANNRGVSMTAATAPASAAPTMRGAPRRYCTYFDRGYLAQGLALWRSLARHDPNAQLTVLALDDFTADVLSELRDPRVVALRLEALLAAEPALALARSQRSRREFIFTLTPFLVAHLLDSLERPEGLVYLDADLFFFATPDPIWQELGNGSVLVVPHRFPRWHDDAELYGRFNVGVVGFRADDVGRACARWWGEQCLASTSLDAAAGNYGDQKYLDAWPARFTGVVESQHAGINAAPWNWDAGRWEIPAGDGQEVRVDGRPLVVFHFAQFKRISDGWFDSGQLEYGVMPARLRSRLYGEYATALLEAESQVKAICSDFRWAPTGWRAALGPWHLATLRVTGGQFWRRGRSWRSLGLGIGRWSGKLLGAYRRAQRRAR